MITNRKGDLFHDYKKGMSEIHQNLRSPRPKRSCMIKDSDFTYVEQKRPSAPATIKMR